MNKSHKNRLFLITTVLIVSVYCLAMILWPLDNISASIVKQTVISKDAPVLDWPGYGQSAIYAEGYGILGTGGEQKTAPIASITKIITALTVLKQKPINNAAESPNITFSQDDVAIYNKYLAIDGVVAPVTPNTTISQYNLMQIMLVASANNYAESLAVWAFGSVDNYLAAAKTFLAENGLQNTTVMDPAGFSTSSASSASDLVKLGKIALENPIVSDIVAKPSVTVAGIGTFYTTNILVSQGKAVGIKTGNTDEAGFCLLFANKTDVSGSPITLIGSILGGTSRASVASDANNLMNSTAAGFYNLEYAKAGQVFATYVSPWGAKANLVSQKSADSVIWAGDTARVTVNAPTVKPGVKQINASANLKAGQVTSTAELNLDHAIAKPSIFWKLTHPIKLLSD